MFWMAFPIRAGVSPTQAFALTAQKSLLLCTIFYRNKCTALRYFTRNKCTAVQQVVLLYNVQYPERTCNSTSPRLFSERLRHTARAPHEGSQEAGYVPGEARRVSQQCRLSNTRSQAYSAESFHDFGMLVCTIRPSSKYELQRFGTRGTTAVLLYYGK